MQHIIICESVNSTMFMHVSDYSDTQKLCKKRFNDIKICF